MECLFASVRRVMCLEYRVVWSNSLNLPQSLKLIQVVQDFLSLNDSTGLNEHTPFTIVGYVVYTRTLLYLRFTNMSHE